MFRVDNDYMLEDEMQCEGCQKKAKHECFKGKKDLKMVIYLKFGCNCKGGMMGVARLKVKE